MDSFRPTAQSYRSNNPRTSSRLALAVAAVMVLGMTGCDSEESKADRQVQQSLDQVYLASSNPESLGEVTNLLNQATAQAAASPQFKALAQATAGHNHYSAAIDKLDALGNAETQVVRQLTRIGQVGGTLALDNAGIQAFRAGNPEGSGDSKPIETIQKNKQNALAKAGETQAQIGKINEQISAAQQKVNQLQQQQQQAQTQAAQLSEQSEAARRERKSEESLNIFKQAAEAKANAGRLGTDLGHAQNELARLQAIVAGLQVELQSLQDTAASSDKQLAALQSAWQETQKLIQERGTSLKTSLDEVGSQAKMLNEAQTNADNLRKEIADTHLEGAIAAYDKAISEATALGQRMQQLSSAAGEAPEKAAYARLQKVHTPARYKVEKARALNLRGALHLRHKALLDARKRLIDGLTSLLQPANLSLPSELSAANLDQQITDVRAAAEKDLKEAEELLGTVAEGAGEPSDKNAALSLRMSTRFALANLLQQPQHLNDAKADLQQLVDQGVTLPSLPASLTAGVRKGAGEQGGGATPQTPAPGTETPAPATTTPATETPAAPTNPQ